MTGALVALAVVALLAAMWLTGQAVAWRRISRRADHELWDPYHRQVALAAAGGQVTYAWVAIAISWVAVICLAWRG